MRWAFFFALFLAPLAYGQCTPPNYCADQSTAVKNYTEGTVPTPPTLNNSYFDPVFHRPIWRWTDGTTAPNSQRTTGARGTPCAVSANCAYDVFAVYLGGTTLGTLGTVASGGIKFSGGVKIQ